MQRLEIVTGLPSALSCFILQDWLSLKSVMALDSAYCCHSYRKDFLDLLRSDEYFIREQLTITNKHDAVSLLNRFGEKISSVAFGEKVTKIQADLVSVRCHHFRQVKFTAANWRARLLRDVLRANPHLEAIKMMHNERHIIPFVHSFAKVVLPKLCTFAAIGYELIDEKILRVMKMGKIIRLDLTRCEVPKPILLDIARLCPALKVLVLVSIYTAETITDDTMKQITALCPCIEHLDIHDSKEITNAGVLNIVQNLKSLRHLNLNHIPELTETSLEHIYTYCASTLHTLLLDRDQQLWTSFDACFIRNLLQRCAQLRRFYFSTDNGYQAYTFPFDAIGNLTTLRINNLICKLNLRAIGTYGAQLRVLIIESAFHYSRDPDILSHLVLNCINLRELHYTMGYQNFDDLPEELTPAYLMKLKPGLLVALKGFSPHWGSGLVDQNRGFRDFKE